MSNPLTSKHVADSELQRQVALMEICPVCKGHDFTQGECTPGGDHVDVLCRCVCGAVWVAVFNYHGFVEVQ